MKKEFNKFVKVFYDHLTNRLGYDDMSKYEYRKTNELRYDLDYIKKALGTKKK